MRQLSNGYGAVRLEGAILTGWRGGCLIGDAVLPMALADARDFMELCLSRDPGRYEPYTHDQYWLLTLTQSPRSKVFHA